MKNTNKTSENQNKRDSSIESLLHSEHLVKIEKMAIGGDGVARINFNEKSVVVFVERAAPEDLLKIKITKIEKNFLKAQISEIITASKYRREAPCKYFNQCGGCAWQHFNETEQVQQKEILLNDLLQKFIPNIQYKLEPSIISEKNFHYRNRIQLKQFQQKLGFFKNSSHEIVDIDECLIADELISNQISILKNKLKPSSEIKKYELKINQNNEFESYRIGEHGEGLAFSQVNNSINEKLVLSVQNIIESINTTDQPMDMTELYSGSGNFTFPILEKFKNLKINSIEMNPDLTQFAVKKLQTLKLNKRLTVFTSDCDFFVERRKLSSEVILLDPPRSGCSDKVIDKVIEASSKNLIYISCHPVYLARDLQKIFSKRNYTIKSLQIFDMFPQTDHFETLVHLSLNNS